MTAVSFHWLHLTDLHCGQTGERHLWPGIRDKFFDDLEKLHDKCGPWHAVLFSGDLVQKGVLEEIDQLEERVLIPPWRKFEQLGSKPVLLTVPGNHDLPRPWNDVARELRPAMKLLQSPEQFHEFADDFFNDPESQHRRIVHTSPAIFVSWFDAWSFCLWAFWENRGCRLPHEHEWEYAAKAGTPWDQNYWWGDEFDSEKCNAEQTVGRTTPPSLADANPRGFQDILGNVWELSQDWYREVYERNAADEGRYRVLRGGSWSYDARFARSAFRYYSDPGYRASTSVSVVPKVPSSSWQVRSGAGRGGRGVRSGAEPLAP